MPKLDKEIMLIIKNMAMSIKDFSLVGHL